MKIALAYYGVLRSFKDVYMSHIENIVRVLLENSIEFDIYVHTWKSGKYVTQIWDKLQNFDNNLDYINVLHPYMINAEDQDESFLNNLNFNDYFRKEIWETVGDNRSKGEWWPTLLQNYLCALESKRRLYNMIQSSNNNYDAVFYLRPDILIHNRLDINSIINIKNNTIIVPSNYAGDGYNEQIGIFSMDTASYYSTITDKLKEYRINIGRIVAEECFKYHIDKMSTNVIQYDFFNYEIRRP